MEEKINKENVKLFLENCKGLICIDYKSVDKIFNDSDFLMNFLNVIFGEDCGTHYEGSPFYNFLFAPPIKNRPVTTYDFCYDGQMREVIEFSIIDKFKNKKITTDMIMKGGMKALQYRSLYETTPIYEHFAILKNKEKSKKIKNKY